MLLVLAGIAGWPLIRTIYFGFTDASLTDFDARQWVGFANYLSVLQMPSGRVIYDGLLVDPVWWRAVWNTVRFTVLSVTAETILGTIVALVLNCEFAAAASCAPRSWSPGQSRRSSRPKCGSGCLTTNSASSTTSFSSST